MDYLNYWNLNRKPFLFPQGDGFFPGIPQREAIAGLSYFVSSGEACSILVSLPDAGLSWLLSHVGLMRGFGDCAAELIVTRGDQHCRQDVLDDICRELGFQPVPEDPFGRIDVAIRNADQQGLRLVWLIDDCETDAADVACELIHAHQNFSTVIGTTRLPLFPITAQSIASPMRIDLGLLSLEDTCNYMRYCIERAGGNSAVISDNAAVRLHEITGGAIGRMALASESALALAANHRLDAITPAVVEAVAERHRRAA